MTAPDDREMHDELAHFEAAHDTGGYRIPFRIREPWGFRPDEHKEW